MRSPFLALGLALLLIPALPARADRVGVSLASGLFLPSMKEFRDIYGAPIPLAFAVSWTKTSGLGFSLGIEYIDKSGRTLGSGDETLPLRFRMWTVPVTISYGYDRGWIRYAAGLGFSLNSYRETWEAAGLENLKLLIPARRHPGPVDRRGPILIEVRGAGAGPLHDPVDERHVPTGQDRQPGRDEPADRSVLFVRDRYRRQSRRAEKEEP